MSEELQDVTNPTSPSDSKPQKRKSSVEDKPYLSLDNLPPLLTIKEASQILRVTPLTLKRWGKRGKLTAIRINARGDRRYTREAILWMLGRTA